MAMRKVGPSQWVWERPDNSEVIDLSDLDLVEELWDEVIDYMLALRAVFKSERLYDARRIAGEVLDKHSKKEEQQ